MGKQKGLRSTKARMLRWLVVSATGGSLISGIAALILGFWRMGVCSNNATCKWNLGMPWTYASGAAFPVIVLILAVLSLLAAVGALVSELLELFVASLKLNRSLMLAIIILLIVSGCLFLLTWILYAIWSNYQGGYPTFGFWFWVMAGVSLFLSAPVQHLAMRWDDERAARAALKH